MNFSDLLNKELIICDLQGGDREAVYTEMLTLLKKVKPQIGAVPGILQDIIEHEKLVDMPYMAGFAMPHTRSAEVEDFYIVIGIHKQGIFLQESDQEKSKLIILCLISKGTSNIYLLSLKALYGYFSKKGISEKAALCTSPDELIQLLADDKVEVKHNITAEDIMLSDFATMGESVMLGEAINYFATSNRTQIPVCDEQQKFIGSLSIESILKAGVPDYIMMMDNIAFLGEFEPFEHLLATEDKMPLRDFINRQPVTCNTHTPLLKIIVDLLKKKTSCFYVLDEQRRLVGIISKRELITNLLRR